MICLIRITTMKELLTLVIPLAGISTMAFHDSSLGMELVWLLEVQLRRKLKINME